MRVAVIGSGGREHALAWRLSLDETVEKIVVLPGSEAMKEVAEVVPVNWENRAELISFLKEARIDLVVIGPEAPLVVGLTDELEREGFAVFGPSCEAAQLEGSKEFAKKIMKKYHIPTAEYEAFQDATAAKAYIEKMGAPIVIKADGLAAGKGVVVAQTVAEACQAVDEMLEQHLFGAAGNTVIIEECLIGEEASLLAFTDGETILPMIAAQDHKRIFDGDKGPNTGGMGAYAPAPILTDALKQQATDEILVPMIAAMKEEGSPYKGCLYAGLMITEKGPRVIEFNARFGDPETQVVLPLFKGDLSKVLLACAKGGLTADMVSWKDGSTACVIMAAKGYPKEPRKGDVISGDLHTATDSVVFHAGTSFVDGQYRTSGGRVLGVTATGTTLGEALATAYERVAHIHFDGMQYRHDIGKKAEKV